MLLFAASMTKKRHESAMNIVQSRENKPGFARLTASIFAGLISGSGFQATDHGGVHNVFMTRSLYTSAREDEVQPFVAGTMRPRTQQRHGTLPHAM